MQVTVEYVEQVCRANVFPVGYQYTVVIISVIKQALSADIPDDYRLKFLNQLDRMVSHENNNWLTAGMIAAIEPMCVRGEEMYREAAKLDREKPGRPGFLDALAKFLPAFAVLNPSLMIALEMEPRRSGYFRPVGSADMTI
jgi:hypothetical protein